MCLDVSFKKEKEIIKKQFPDVQDQLSVNFTNEYMENVQAVTFPLYPIIYKDSSGLVLKEMEWGIDPFYIDDYAKRNARRISQVNARSERILNDKDSIWYKLRHNRCLIPVSGIFEHRAIQGWKKKVPYHIAEAGREVFYLPGLYQINGKDLSFTMITRAANTLMSQIHNLGDHNHRMPLFFPEVLEKNWLGEIDDLDMAQMFKYEIPSEKLEAYPVYTLRNSPERPDHGHRYDPYNWANLPPLGNDDPSIQGRLF